MRRLFFTLLLMPGYLIAAADEDIWMQEGCYIAQEYREPRSVSFIYYPTGNDPLGHAELEINGQSWNLLDGSSYGKRPLSALISKATSKGQPFFRFIFDVDQDDIQEMKKYIYKSKCSTNCCRAALYPLAQADVCYVPFPCNISPLLTALYLKSGKTLGLNKVQKIEYYGNASLSKSIIKMLPGVVLESANPLLLSVIYTYIGVHLDDYH